MFLMLYSIKELAKNCLRPESASLINYSPKQVPAMMTECNYYVKVCFKKAELMYKHFYRVPGDMHFNLKPKRLSAKKNFWVGGRLETSRRNEVRICVMRTL